MILMNDFRAESAEVQAAMLQGVQRVLSSGWYVLGEEGRRFEQAWAARCGMAEGVGVGNGLDALEIGLRVLGIGPGDEVITTPMTAFATVLAVQRAGAIPVLADIDPRTGLLDPVSVKRCLSPRTRAVLLVHLYGQLHAPGEWQALCRTQGLYLLEDCAQSHLARWDGQSAGSFGEFGAYSFYPTKNLGAAGDAGMLVLHDPQMAERARCLRNYGQSERYHHPELGMNSRLDEMQAALLLARLPFLAHWTARRQAIAARYRAELQQSAVRLLAAPAQGQSESHVYHLFVIACAQRATLQAHLTAAGVQTLCHYPVPVHQQPPATDWPRDPAGLLHAERHAAQCLSLPCHPGLSDGEVERVIAAVNAFCG